MSWRNELELESCVGEVVLLVATWIMIGVTLVATYRLGYVRGEGAALESYQQAESYQQPPQKS